MKYGLLICLYLLPFNRSAAQDFYPAGLQCEHLENPMGIDIAVPRFTWRTHSEIRNWRQSARQIQTSLDSAFSSILWDSGIVPGETSLNVSYEGPALRSMTRYFWRVKVWDAEGRESAWSKTAFWETALTSPAEWRARWIEPEPDTVRRFSPAPMVRREFTLKQKPLRARAYVTARGVYRLFCNGGRVGDQELAPGWTVYPKRHAYQTYDLTDQLREGVNAVGAMIGDGWFRSGLGWEYQNAFYGKKAGFLCQIYIQYPDGTEEWILSDKTWKAWTNGPVRRSEIYYGEDCDANFDLPGWDTAGFDDSAWHFALETALPYSHLFAAAYPPIRAVGEIKPLRVFRTPAGELVADMGQNMVGRVRLKVKGKKGKIVTLRHAEVLDKKGNFYTANLRKAKQQFVCTLRGGGEETFEPRFTFMGFRYVHISGYPGVLTPDDLTGVVLHSDMKPSGQFECSDARLNQLQSNIVWGQKGNFVDVPTDCPQRDERMGWTGDAQVFARTAAFNFDVSAFFAKWLADLTASQRQDGAVPYVVPDVLNKLHVEKVRVSAGWGDAATIIPWTVYQAYDDRRILEAQYPSMKAYVDYIHAKSGDSLIWKKGSVFGDWLFFHPNTQGVNSHTTPDGHTNLDLISTAFFAHSADLTSRAAEVLGKTGEAAIYRNLYKKIKAVFIKEFVTSSGRVASESQTAYVLALHFNLLPEHLRPAALGYLIKDIRDRKNHLSTGFLGTPYICSVLSENGRADVAYDLLFQDTWPSWLYPVKMGATTIWERWDGQKPDSTFQDVTMNSFNHYAYGAVGDWMYRVAAGLRPDTTGYKRILFQPELTPRLNFARARYQSAYGEIACGWERKEGKIHLNITAPPNTSARIRIPEKSVATLLVDDLPAEASKYLKIKGINAGLLELEAGSGRYKLVWTE